MTRTEKLVLVACLGLVAVSTAILAWLYAVEATTAELGIEEPDDY